MTTDSQDEIAALEARLEALRANEPVAAKSEHEANKAVASERSGKLMGGWVLAGGAAVILAAIIIGSLGADKASTGLQTSIESTDALLERLNGPDVGSLKDHWTYDTGTDAMTDGRTEQACIHSRENVRQEWPYETVPAVLCLRESSRSGLDAYIYLKGDGQLLSRREGMKVRFDDGTQEFFGGNDAADGSSNVAFFSNPRRFLNGVKNADLTRVELIVYNAGVQVVEFNTKGLVWPRP